jgi:tetratricopeptide (TPR) repeat protein
LCEFQLKAYDTALTDLLRGRTLGIENKELVSVGRYHTAILMTRIEQYEQAMQVLTDFATEGNDSPRVIEALGLAALRMPMLPADLPGTKRDLVMLAGRASYFTSARVFPAAQKAFEELISRYPETPNVHYAYGVFLTAEQPDKAIEQFKEELKISPRHPCSALQIAFEYIKRRDWEAARPWAEQAVSDDPGNSVGHRAMGQVLLETGDVDGAIAQFEAGAKIAPDSPAMRFALARAYRRAGRTADAEREQAKFTELDRLVRTQRSGAQSVGGIEVDSMAAPQTSPSPQ